MIEEFEQKRAQVIVGVRKENGISYAMKFKDGAIRMFPSHEVKLNWPKLLEQYLTERIGFTMNNRIDNDDRIETAQLQFADGNPPTAILGCTNIGGLQFWCELEDGNRKLFPLIYAEECDQFRKLVFEYLESQLASTTDLCEAFEYFDHYISM